MNLKSFSSRSSDASSTRAHPHSLGQHQLNRSIFASVLSLAAVATVCQPEQAGAVTTSLLFNDPVQANNVTSVNGHGAGYVSSPNTGATVFDFRNVASGVDARLTSTPFGTGYTMLGQVPNFGAPNASGINQSSADAAFVYTAGQVGVGGMTYKFDFFQTNGTTHTFTTAATLADFNFIIYDIDGESTQSEALRVFKGSDTGGLNSYRIGQGTVTSTDGTTGIGPLSVSENANSYLFSGGGHNIAETSVNGDVLLNFLNTSSVTLQFEANTTGGVPNNVYSGIDGDKSILPNTTATVAGNTVTGDGAFASAVTAKKIPEPFTVIGTLIGGGVAFRMRKKLKATSKA
ncbi:PEP-CTERM sorting domain-containing protein [Chamaesiphon sp. VAR_69_metabat_338]|uniref:PEP-CTERM sorting domain-containing protein n=1 Tax=Chamaesiphon sp. VAR_69_metabat_338 TaxID=2964704 RepID=UPI00286D7FF0|nr:PEP-CTERM sorting domain-containing protein [Chamaesiphon sp. VAR_69_metabat_338]